MRRTERRRRPRTGTTVPQACRCLRELGGAKQIQTGAPADWLDLVGAADLRQEGGHRILAGDGVALLAYKLEPRAVMDRLAGLTLVTQHFYCHLAQPLPSQSAVELVEARLC